MQNSYILALQRPISKPLKFAEEEYKKFKLGNNTDSVLEEINHKLEQLKIGKINTLDIPLEERGEKKNLRVPNFNFSFVRPGRLKN